MLQRGVLFVMLWEDRGSWSGSFLILVLERFYVEISAVDMGE